MTAEGVGYPLPTGDYAIEGFAFVLKGSHGEFTITPERALLPTWIIWKSAFIGAGVHAEHFRCEITVGGPRTIFSELIADLERLRLGQGVALEFPSKKATEFLRPQFQCTIARDQFGSKGWSMHMRVATPSRWQDGTPPTAGEYERDQFAGAMNVLMALDLDCLEVVRAEIATFLQWLDREAASIATARET